MDEVITLSSDEEMTSEKRKFGPNSREEESSGRSTQPRLTQSCTASGSKSENVSGSPEAVGVSRVKGLELASKVIHAGKKLMVSQEDKRIIEKIKKLVDKTSLDYLSSQEFHKACEKIIENISKRPISGFVFLRDFVKLLRRNQQDKSIVKKRKYDDSEGSQGDEKKICFDVTESNDEDNITKDSDGSCNLSHYDVKTQRKIAYYELILKKLHEKRQSLYKKEIGVDSDDEDVFILEEKLEKKIMLVWKKLCKLAKQPESLGRSINKKFFYQGCRYPEINVAVENFLNKRRIFPDYSDILKLVSQVNSSNSLLICRQEQEIISQEIFKEIGEKLRSRRIKDFVDLFGCNLTDKSWDYDPAESDQELQTRLQKNSELGEHNLNKVFSTFAQKQSELNLSPEEVPDDEVDSSSEESEGDAGIDKMETKEDDEDDLKCMLGTDTSTDEAPKSSLLANLRSKLQARENGTPVYTESNISEDGEVKLIPIEVIESDDDSKESKHAPIETLDSDFGSEENDVVLLDGDDDLRTTHTVICRIPSTEKPSENNLSLDEADKENQSQPMLVIDSVRSEIIDEALQSDQVFPDGDTVQEIDPLAIDDGLCDKVDLPVVFNCEDPAFTNKMPSSNELSENRCVEIELS